MFRRWNLWPIYPWVKTLDGYNFATKTLWSKTSGDGSGFYFREFVGEATEMSDVGPGAYDYLLASHVLEHIANPLKALNTWKRVLRPEGILILVVPHRDGTFDHRRPITTLDHIVDDFRKSVTEADETHVTEIVALHDLGRDPGAGSQEAFLKRAARNAEYRSLHHHVFDTELVLRLVDRANLEIEYLDIEMPYHICVACSSKARSGGMEGRGKSANEAYLGASATWRTRSRFPSDRDSGHGSVRP